MAYRADPTAEKVVFPPTAGGSNALLHLKTTLVGHGPSPSLVS